MDLLASIFLDFNLPNAPTWFYSSLLLAFALFFKFSRLFSIRNWDILTLFLLIPGLLLVQEAHEQLREVQLQVNQGALSPEAGRGLVAEAVRLRWFGYLALFGGSAYFFIRCLIDLALVRRPALGPNLNLGGLAWLSGALMVLLVAVAVRTAPSQGEVVGKESVSVQQAENQLGILVKNQTSVASVVGLDSRFCVGCTLALGCHLAVVAGLIFIGARHFQDPLAGMAMATLYLLLPYTYLHVNQWHHVWPVALLLWGVAAYRRPTLAGLCLGLAAGTMYFPALVLPVWLGFYWRRGSARFLAGFVLAGGMSLAAAGFLLWLNGDLEKTVQSALTLSDWQPWKVPSAESFWRWINDTGVTWAYRIPVFVAYLAFLAVTLFWPAPKNLAHVIALSAALLIGIQFWYADQGGVYVLWYLPLLLLLTFRPNLADRRPPLVAAEGDWLFRLGRAAFHIVAQLLTVPDPVVRVR